jgi:curved DNA-binding protein CbpA
MTDSSNKKTLYEILGVKPDANLVDIQIAHEGLLGAAEGALDAAERVALKEAYRILADSRRRAAYDQSLRRRARASVESVDEDDEPSGRSKTPLVVVAVVVLLVGGWWFTRSPEKSASSAAVPVARATPATTAEPNAASAAASAAGAEVATDKLLLGRWHCKGPLTGNGLDLNFASDGGYTGQVEGQQLRGDYIVNGAALTFRDPEQSNGFAIEELSPQRLVIHRGEGKRLSCNR